MSWKDGHVCVFHAREPWPESMPPVFVQNRLDVMKGAEGTPNRDIYAAAKMHFTMGAAEEVVKRCVTKSAMDSLIAHTIAGGLDARIIVPHPAFDDANGEAIVSKNDVPINALPFAYSAFLQRTLGCEPDEDIVQIARVGRTKLSKWPRFLYQPTFGGVVRPGQSYIIADDVISTGGTFAALRSYIVRNGGSVVFATALANATGKNQEFSISKQTVNYLMQSFGPGLHEFWTETVGHDIRCLTETEGNFLREWSDAEQTKGCARGDELLQRLRGELDEAATKKG
jgi:hypothetical protein